MDSVKITLYIRFDDLKSSNYKTLMQSLMVFKPQDMLLMKATRNKRVRYNEKLFLASLEDELATDNVSIDISGGGKARNRISITSVYKFPEVSTISFVIEEQLFEKHKNEAMQQLDGFFAKNNGIVGEALSLKDWFWQNNQFAHYYQAHGRSMDGIITRPSKRFKGEMEVDLECLPGHSHHVNGIWFGSCWRMWFGREYYQYISKEALLSFPSYFETKDLGNDAICVSLYESPWDYENEESRARQWSFRKTIGMDDIAHSLELTPQLSTRNMDPTIEIRDGNFEHGGIKQLIYYYDEKGELTEKSKCHEVRTFELDEKGKEVWAHVEKMQ